MLRNMKIGYELKVIQNAEGTGNVHFKVSACRNQESTPLALLPVNTLTGISNN
jgi:hypothetical protein